MDNNLLPERFQRILDLTTVVDIKLYQKMVECISPLRAKDKAMIFNDVSFSSISGGYSLFFNSDDSYLNLDNAYDKSDKSVYKNLKMITLTENHLDRLKNNPQNRDPIRLATMSISDSYNSPRFEMRVTDFNNGRYRLDSTTHNRVLCFEYVLDLSYESGNYVLTTSKFISNCQDLKYGKRVIVSEDYLQNNVCVDDCYAMEGSDNKIFDDFKLINPRHTTDFSSDDFEDFIKGLFGL